MPRSTGALFVALVLAAEAKTSIYRSNYTLAVSETLPGSLLPSFRFQLSQVEGGSLAVPIGGGALARDPFVPDDSCPEEIWDHASEDLHAPQLPHLSQDLWTCERGLI